jgi:hypothetical protein
MNMWKAYGVIGTRVIQALHERGEDVRHEGPGPDFYPNRIVFADSIVVNFSVSPSETWYLIFVEINPRIQRTLIRFENLEDEIDWNDIANLILIHVGKIREARARADAARHARREAQRLTKAYAFGDTPFYMIADGTKVRFAMAPVEATKAQVEAMKAAAVAVGLHKEAVDVEVALVVFPER